ncbi:MAG: hypothetical protein ABI197_11465 [Granulicella sp.]
MSTPWPPPPDLESVRELLRDADVEGLIAIHGAPADEYDTEAEAFYAAIAHLPSDQITVDTQLPILESIWHRNFVSDDAELNLRRPALQGIAEQMTRFFGPDANPQTRQ